MPRIKTKRISSKRSTRKKHAKKRAKERKGKVELTDAQKRKALMLCPPSKSAKELRAKRDSRLKKPKKTVLPKVVDSRRRVAAIDLGAKNLFTMVTNGCDYPIAVRCPTMLGWLNGKNWKEASASIRNRLISFLELYCTKRKIQVLVIGDLTIDESNKLFLQRINYSLMKSRIQTFCDRKGIQLDYVDEYGTSKQSFLDNDTGNQYSGSRYSRRWYRSKKGIRIEADVNAAYNIMKRKFPRFVVEDLLRINPTISVWTKSVTITV